MPTAGDAPSDEDPPVAPEPRAATGAVAVAEAAEDATPAEGRRPPTDAATASPQPDDRPSGAAPSEAAEEPGASGLLEDDLPPDFWDDRVSFDDLAPTAPRSDGAAADTRSPSAPAGDRGVEPAASGEGAVGDPGESGAGAPGRARSVPSGPPTGASAVGRRSATEELPDDDGEAVEGGGGADTFDALRRLFPGRILAVDPVESDDDRSSAEAALDGADGGPLFDPAGDGDDHDGGVD